MLYSSPYGLLRPFVPKVTLALLVAVAAATGAGAQTAGGTTPHLADVRSHHYVVTFTGPGAFTWEETLEVEVYGVDGARMYQTISEYYSDASAVDVMEAEVWSAGEKKPESLKKRDRRDYAPTDMTTVASDARVATMTLPLPRAYPAVIKTRTLRIVKESVGLPPVTFAYPAGVTVRAASLKLAGDRQSVLTKVIDPQGLLETSDADGVTEYSVGQVGLSAKREDYAPSPYRTGPTVWLTPRTATLGGVKGDFANWDGMGAWTAELLSDRSALPPEAIAEVRALVTGISDVRTRVERVYAYMQSRTHYVSIQLGIGGFKPMDPASVHQLGYGDCKALSNYTRLLLGAVDIPANYCIVGAADSEIFLPEFASVTQANHAILAVPLARDTMWLECTSQTDPADYASAAWTAGRYVLWVGADGGQLVRTRGAQASDNSVSSFTTIDLTDGKDALFTRRSTYRGTQLDLPVFLRTATAADRRRAAQSQLALTLEGLDPQVTIQSTADGPVGTVRDMGQLRGYRQTVGKRLVMPTFGYLPDLAAPRDTVRRQRPVSLTEGYVRVDTLQLVLPKGAQTSSPNPVSLSGPQGSYRLSAVAVDPSREELVASGTISPILTLERRLTINAGTYPAEDAGKIARFAAAVKRADAGYTVAVLDGTVEP